MRFTSSRLTALSSATSTRAAAAFVAQIVDDRQLGGVLAIGRLSGGRTTDESSCQAARKAPSSGAGRTTGLLNSTEQPAATQASAADRWLLDINMIMAVSRRSA